MMPHWFSIKYDLRKGLLLYAILMLSITVFAKTQTDANIWGIDTITISSEPDYYPFCYVNEAGEADGFSVELFKAACDASKINYRIRIGIWQHIKKDLSRGDIDALPFVARSPEREELFDFSIPYMTLHGAVFINKNDRGTYKSMHDLKNKSIVVMKDDHAEEYLRRIDLTTQISTTPTFQEAFKLLNQGQYDAIIMQRITGIYMVETLELKNVVALDMRVPDFEQSFSFAVKKGNDTLLHALNEGLSVVIANKTIYKLRQKWLGPQQDAALTRQEIINIFLKILIPTIAVLFAIWVIILGLVVKHRTRKLKNEIKAHKETALALEKHKNKLQLKAKEVEMLLNSTAEGIFGLDKEGKFTFANLSAQELLEIDDPKEVIGKNFHKIINHTQRNGDEIDQEHCQIHSTFTRGIKVYSDSEAFHSLTGKTIPVEYYSYPIIDNQEIVGSVTTFTDITERLRKDADLKELNERLEEKVEEQTTQLTEKVEKLDKSQQAMLFMVEDLNEITEELKEERSKLAISNKELEAFTYSVSHDLRAPLRAINGFTKFLKEDHSGNLDDEGRRFVDTIIENAEKMDRLITDLLNLSRVGRGDLKLTEVDMKATADSMYREVIMNSNIDGFEINIDDIPSIQADSGLIKQVWQNLIHNAVKYSSKSTHKKISIGFKKNKNEYIYFIRDTGTGFNEKYAHKLFGPFQRLHRNDEFEGTGVGLALVYRIIKKHGGRIWAESPDKEGATFYFTIPENQSVKTIVTTQNG